MSLETVTTRDSTAEVLRSAERLLTRRTGAQVVLVDPEDLGGSDRTVVLRVRPRENPFSLPRTMVVKKVLTGQGGRDAEEAFLRETVSYQFANSLPLEHRPGATLVAHDVADRVLVLADLGGAPTLADVLADPDPVLAQRGLVAWAQALGRMHAATAFREGDFAALLRHAGRARWTDPLEGPATAALAELPAALESALGVRTPTEVVRRATATDRVLGRSVLRAFSPSDLCPDNAMLTAAGVQFLDFEWGGFRDVFLDAVYALVPFPGCWCSPQLSADQAEHLVQAWRGEVVGVWPQLADDALLRAGLLDAQLLWTWVSTRWFLPGHATRADPSSEHPLALRPADALAVRWTRLAESAERAGEAATAAHARTVAAALPR
jgi:hypothetical protein